MQRTTATGLGSQMYLATRARFLTKRPGSHTVLNSLDSRAPVAGPEIVAPHGAAEGGVQRGVANALLFDEPLQPA
jgi:hypothetical protein